MPIRPIRRQQRALFTDGRWTVAIKYPAYTNDVTGHSHGYQIRVYRYTDPGTVREAIVYHDHDGILFTTGLQALQFLHRKGLIEAYTRPEVARG